MGPRRYAIRPSARDGISRWMRLPPCRPCCWTRSPVRPCWTPGPAGAGRRARSWGPSAGGGGVMSHDRRAGAHRRLREAQARLGLDRLYPVQADARQASRLFTRPMDRVLVDAPCSGLGTLRRHPERKWTQQEAGLAALARLEQELLRGVAPLVKSGGLLVYSACSLEPEETDLVVEAFLREFPDFAPDDPRTSLPTTAGELVDRAGAVRTWPHRHGIDGFYALRLT